MQCKHSVSNKIMQIKHVTDYWILMMIVGYLLQQPLGCGAVVADAGAGVPPWRTKGL